VRAGLTDHCKSDEVAIVWVARGPTLPLSAKRSQKAQIRGVELAARSNLKPQVREKIMVLPNLIKGECISIVMMETDDKRVNSTQQISFETQFQFTQYTADLGHTTIYLDGYSAIHDTCGKGSSEERGGHCSCSCHMNCYMNRNNWMERYCSALRYPTRDMGVWGATRCCLRWVRPVPGCLCIVERTSRSSTNQNSRLLSSSLCLWKNHVDKKCPSTTSRARLQWSLVSSTVISRGTSTSRSLRRMKSLVKKTRQEMTNLLHVIRWYS
jgi:hypothetical protein